MARDVYEALENNGRKVVSDWDIPSDLRAKLERKLDMLASAEVDASGKVTLPTGTLAGPNIYNQQWIYKVIVNGNQALRPMVCLGPADRDTEWTVLARAKERDRDTREQKAAAATATLRRQEILDGTRQRVLFLEAKR